MSCVGLSTMAVCKCVHVLCRFVNYGSGAKRFPLQEVLQYALEFAQSKPDGIDSPPLGSGGGDNTEYIPIQDVEMESPKSQARSVSCHTWHYRVTVNMSQARSVSCHTWHYRVTVNMSQAKSVSCHRVL